MLLFWLFTITATPGAGLTPEVSPLGILTDVEALLIVISTVFALTVTLSATIFAVEPAFAVAERLLLFTTTAVLAEGSAFPTLVNASSPSAMPLTYFEIT